MSSPFTEKHAALFDDGLDPIDSPEALEGQWQEEWATSFDQRMAEADAVLLAYVRALHTDVDLDRRQTYRVAVEVERTIKGAAEGAELSLQSRERAQGYPSLERHRERVLNRRYVVFLKYALEDQEVVGHFHLAPASRAALERVEAYEQGKKPRNITVITHSN